MDDGTMVDGFRGSGSLSDAEAIIKALINLIIELELAKQCCGTL